MAQRAGVPGQGVTILGGGGVPNGPTSPVYVQLVGDLVPAADMGFTLPLVIPVGTTATSSPIPCSGWKNLKLFVNQVTPAGGSFSYSVVPCDSAGNALNAIAGAPFAGSGAAQRSVLYVGETYSANFYHNLGTAQGVVGAVGPGPFPGEFFRIALTNAAVGPSTVSAVEVSLGD